MKAEVPVLDPSGFFRESSGSFFLQSFFTFYRRLAINRVLTSQSLEKTVELFLINFGAYFVYRQIPFFREAGSSSRINGSSALPYLVDQVSTPFPLFTLYLFTGVYIYHGRRSPVPSLRSIIFSPKN